MKKLTKKSVMLFAATMAACAFALPSVASAASWGVVGSHHTLDSPNFGFTQTFGGSGMTSSCTSSSFTARVLNGGDLSIQSGSFGGLCTFGGSAVGDCTLTLQATGFPWRATAVTTSNIQIHGIDIDITFENPPAATGGVCNVPGLKETLTGILISGRWTGNTIHPRIDFADAEGLVMHSALGNGVPVTIRGSFTDTNSLHVN